MPAKLGETAFVLPMGLVQQASTAAWLANNPSHNEFPAPSQRLPTIAAMQASRPRYVLIAETETAVEGPQWRFALHAADASMTVAACDSELDADDDRLVLLAVVRGLEALDQSAEVTIVTRCASVLRGLTRGLAEWRNNHWRWERFGRLTPIRDADLWRRVDQALRYHTIHCRSWRTDQAVEQRSPRKPHFARRIDAPAAPSEAPSRRPTTPPLDEPFIEGKPDSPAMVIVRSARARRRVRLADPAVAC